MPLSTSRAFTQLTRDDPIGTSFGQNTTEIIAFYGGATNNGTTFTGAIQSTIVAGNYATCCTVPSQSATTASVTTWGFASSTQANALIGLLDWAYRVGILS